MSDRVPDTQSFEAEGRKYNILVQCSSPTNGINENPTGFSIPANNIIELIINTNIKNLFVKAAITCIDDESVNVKKLIGRSGTCLILINQEKVVVDGQIQKKEVENPIQLICTVDAVIPTGEKSEDGNDIYSIQLSGVERRKLLATPYMISLSPREFNDVDLVDVIKESLRKVNLDLDEKSFNEINQGDNIKTDYIVNRRANAKNVIDNILNKKLMINIGDDEENNIDSFNILFYDMLTEQYRFKNTKSVDGKIFELNIPIFRKESMRIFNEAEPKLGYIPTITAQDVCVKCSELKISKYDQQSNVFYDQIIKQESFLKLFDDKIKQLVTSEDSNTDKKIQRHITQYDDQHLNIYNDMVDVFLYDGFALNIKPFLDLCLFDAIMVVPDASGKFVSQEYTKLIYDLREKVRAIEGVHRVCEITYIIKPREKYFRQNVGLVR